MDYNFVPFGAHNRGEFYINPENLISLEDFCVLIENNAPFYIANYIKEYGLQFYYHRDFIHKDGRQKMICLPLKFISIGAIEYKLLSQRLYFLKRDINEINEKNSIQLLPDNILESANSQICNTENKTEIAKLTIEKIDRELTKVKKAPVEEFLLVCGVIILFFAIPLRALCCWLKNNDYLKSKISAYNGSSLKALDEEGAKEIIKKTLDDNNITQSDLNKNNTSIRNLLALNLKEGGISTSTLVELLYPADSKAKPKSKSRSVRQWVQNARETKNN